MINISNIENEIPAKLRKSFVDENLVLARQWNKNTYDYFNNKYLKNWDENNDIKKFQRVL
ncbi:MAG: hypothetical protein GF311_27020 [Candidatus Lokiarchaeota archaeon]|nr:hypothetical protein [Candidatus Lokiarchaeota archaeon]